LTSPFGSPFTKFAEPFDIFGFLDGNSEGEKGEVEREAGEENLMRSDDEGNGLRSEATGTITFFEKML